MRSLPLVAVVLGLHLAAAAYAQTPTCDALGAEQKAQAADLFAEIHPYDCCDATLAECLRQEPMCALAWRLAENVCRRVAAKMDRTRIIRSLHRRARSMMPTGKTATINVDGWPVIGSPEAPVTVVEYACARCPFCAKITPQLHQAIAAGPLAGKVKLYFKVFPIRNHKYSKDAGLGFLAAAELGKFWEFALLSYERFEDFCPAKQPEWAVAVGMDRTAFEKLVAASRTRERLVASKKEGVVNKVEATPTFFINGRKFVGDVEHDEIIDVLEEEYDRATGIRYREAKSVKH